MKKYRAIGAVCFIIMVPLLTLYASGYRLSIQGALNSVRYLQSAGQNILVQKAITPDIYFYLVDTGDQYHTCYVKRDLLFWKGADGQMSQQKSEYKIELLNVFHFEDASGWIVLNSHDPHVDRVEVSIGETVISQKIKTDIPTAIVFNTSVQTNGGADFEAIAYGSDNTPLYKLDNYRNKNVIDARIYRWWPIDDDGKIIYS